jgi:UDPglucose--hexose-1-phosphate uridylyltransferase
VRVVPNKYALVGGDVRGVHEVVVLSPAHDCDLTRLDREQARTAVRMLRDRAADHRDSGLAFVQAFVNHGRAAGASRGHPHAQLVALDFVPPAAADQAKRFAAAADDLVTASLSVARDRGLVLVDGAGAHAWSPWAAATPYEVVVAADDAGDDFASASDGELDAVTDHTREVLGRVRRALGAVPYNVVFHGAPGGHWYAAITVRTFTHAGFEMGTGILANPVLPELAVERLRGVG